MQYLIACLLVILPTVLMIAGAGAVFGALVVADVLGGR